MFASLRFPVFAPAPRTTEETGPPRRRVTGPVFIHDCVAPCMGTTLLHVLWERDLARLREAEDED
ncbi:MAG: hypothetical protein ACU0CO_01710 [Shimia sp.]